MPIEVNETITIPDEELHWQYARSGGPGGQNVNKVESKAILRWTMLGSQALDEAVKLRLRKIYPSAVTNDGEVLITSQRYRDRPRNMEDCVEKLVGMILAALVVPKARKKTKPTKGSQVRRLEDKKRNTQRKAQRRSSGDE